MEGQENNIAIELEDKMMNVVDPKTRQLFYENHKDFKKWDAKQRLFSIAVFIADTLKYKHLENIQQASFEQLADYVGRLCFSIQAKKEQAIALSGNQSQQIQPPVVQPTTTTLVQFFDTNPGDSNALEYLERYFIGLEDLGQAVGGTNLLHKITAFFKKFAQQIQEINKQSFLNLCSCISKSQISTSILKNQTYLDQLYSAAGIQQNQRNSANIILAGIVDDKVGFDFVEFVWEQSLTQERRLITKLMKDRNITDRTLIAQLYNEAVLRHTNQTQGSRNLFYKIFKATGMNPLQAGISNEMALQKYPNKKLF